MTNSTPAPTLIPKEKSSRTLKVVNKPYKETYTPSINLQGRYLRDYGFEVGDMVNLEVSRNKILIEKILLPKIEQ